MKKIGKNQVGNQHRRVRLIDVPISYTGTVQKIFLKPESFPELPAGIQKGIHLRVLGRVPGKYIVVYTGCATLALHECLAQNIEVEVDPDS